MISVFSGALARADALPNVAAEPQPKIFNVRVLLTQEKIEKLESGWSWIVTSPQGFIIRDINDPSAWQEFTEPDLKLAFKKGHLTINGHRLADNVIEIVPKEGSVLGFKGNTYEGTFIFMQYKDDLLLINSVDLEDYVFSVLRWEGWPGWSLEVNRAFAVMCRTYAVNKILEARAQSRGEKPPFDIKCTNVHQTYKGRHEFIKLREAVEDTRSLIMTYQDKPIVAMYDSCCGGVIPAKIKGQRPPYLDRGYACTYCKKCSLHSWRLDYSLSDLEDLIKADVKNGVPVKDFHISKQDEAMVVHEVIVTTNSAKFALTGKKIYSLLKDIKSLCFSVTKKGKKVSFKGQGFGHLLGLCQWGAEQMSKAGLKYKDILKYYYPGIIFMEVEIV